MLTFNTSLQCHELLLSSLNSGSAAAILMLGRQQNVKREAPDPSGIRPLGVGEAGGHQEDAATVEC